MENAELVGRGIRTTPPAWKMIGKKKTLKKKTLKENKKRAHDRQIMSPQNNRRKPTIPYQKEKQNASRRDSNTGKTRISTQKPD